MSREPPDPIYILRGCKSPVTSLLYHNLSSSGDGNSRCSGTSSCSLLAGTQEGQLYLWDTVTRRTSAVVEAHHGSVLSVLTKPTQPKTILTQGRDGWFHCWDAAAPAITKIGSLRTQNPGFCRVDCVALDNTDAVILPTENQSQVDVVCLDTKEQLMSFKPKTGGVSPRGMSMHIQTFSGSNGLPYLLVGYEDGSISIWDFRASAEVDSMKFHDEMLMAFDYHARANRGLTASVDVKLSSWTLSTSQEFQKMRDMEISNPGVGCVRFRPDGKLVVAGGWDGRVRVFSAKKQSPLAVLEQHKETVQCVTFSPDGILAVGSKDKHISIWDIYR